MGIIYIMTNPAMPDLVKIGKTENTLEQRQKELYTTGVPFPFEVHYAGEVDDAAAVELLLHKAFGDHRKNPKREFFRIAPEKIVAAFQLAKPKDVTPSSQQFDSPEEERAMQSEVQRRSRLRLDKIGIPVGAELVFTRDDSIRVKVVPGSKIEFEGEVKSLSGAAGEILHRMGLNSRVSGSVFWTYEGQTLDERRMELDERELGEED